MALKKKMYEMIVANHFAFRSVLYTTHNINTT